MAWPAWQGVQGDALRILFLTAYPAIGGPLPKLAPVVVDGLRRCGFDVLVRGWSAHRAGRESLVPRVLGRAMDLARACIAVREWRPEVIFVATSHNWPALLRDVPLALCMPRSGPPLVLHLHGSECGKLGQRGQRVFTALSTWLVRRAAAVLLLSTEERDVWERFCPGCRFELVSNPFSSPDAAAATKLVAKRADAHPKEATLLFVGRLVVEKGVLDLLEAFSIVRRTYPCRLRIAGVGPAEDDIVRRVGVLGLTESVDLLGYVTGSELAHAYRSADVFVLPSYREGFPLVVMEAMGYGLPIVTTPIRGCADHLIAGEHALFAPPQNAEALAGRLLELLRDDAQRRRMGEANLTRVLEFAPPAVIPRYAEILRSVVPRR